MLEDLKSIHIRKKMDKSLERERYRAFESVGKYIDVDNYAANIA